MIITEADYAYTVQALKRAKDRAENTAKWLKSEGYSDEQIKRLQDPAASFLAGWQDDVDAYERAHPRPPMSDCCHHLAVKNLPLTDPRTVKYGMTYFVTACGFECSNGAGRPEGWQPAVPREVHINTATPVYVNKEGKCLGCFPETPRPPTDTTKEPT